MQKNTDIRIILVTRKTRLQELIERFNSWPQAKFYLEHKQMDVADYLTEHDTYQFQIKQAESILQQIGRYQHIERQFVPQFKFQKGDIVVVIGQDGLVANTLKYLDGQPVIGINPDPARWDGKLLAFTINDLKSITKSTIKHETDCKSITFAQAVTNDGQTMLAVNDLFIGPKSHTTAQYEINWNGQKEIQWSSGVIISTGFGSTGWLSSVLNGAFGITATQQTHLKNGFDWNDNKLIFAVREPFASQVSFTNVTFGAITAKKPMRLTSLMPENGVIFSDGLESDFIEFNSGCQLSVSVAQIEGKLVLA